MVIAFNYKEASKTVTLKEVNGSIIECSGAPEKNPHLSTTSVGSFQLNPSYRTGEIPLSWDEITS